MFDPEAKGISSDVATVSVNELQCFDPACPSDAECSILILREGSDVIICVVVTAIYFVLLLLSYFLMTTINSYYCTKL